MKKIGQMIEYSINGTYSPSTNFKCSDYSRSELISMLNRKKITLKLVQFGSSANYNTTIYDMFLNE